MPDCNKCRRADCPGWTRCRLVELQSMSELKRKAGKAARRKQKIWTAEEIDYACKKANEWAEYFLKA